MTDYPTPRDAAEHAVNGELKPHAADVLLDREGFCIQLLGMDSEGRAVYYCSDDGSLIRYEYVREDHELERDTSRHIGRSLDSEASRVDPFGAAFAYLTTHGENWTWTHPRFRWMVDELDELNWKQTA